MDIMEGITILNQTEITRTPLWIVILVPLCMLIVFVGLFLMDFGANKKTKYIGSIMGISAVLTCVVCMILGVFIKSPTGKYKYDCLINEDVSLTEFDEKYEVLKVNGKIWTIKEK